MERCEQINPYGDNDSRAKGEQVEQMFDSIAPAYDFMNRAMTMGVDRRWRRKAVEMVAAGNPREILDVATGTGDLAMLMACMMPEASVTGIDLSEGMLNVGRQKVAEAGMADRISFSRADCLHLPMPDNTFDAVTVAYGVRNFENLAAGYAEMLRVLRPGGMLCVIELSTPTSALVKPFYRAYTHWIIPLAGRLASHDVRAYSYLPESIAAVPQGEHMLNIMRQAGFTNPRSRTFTFGVCSVYTAFKI